jgi:mRNA interferase MazF
MVSAGLTQFKLRPAVVISKDANNQRLDDVIGAPCSSNILRSREPTQYLIDGSEVTVTGVRVPSVVRCEALMTIPKTLIVRPLGQLSDAALAAVGNCLRDALAL